MSAPFNETVNIDGLVIDTETGEIIEWPEGLHPEQRFNFLSARRDEAARQFSRWESLKGYYSRSLGALLTAMGTKKHVTDDWSAQWVEPKPRRSLSPDVVETFMAAREIPAGIQLAAYREIVKTVDPDKFIQVFGDDEDIVALITETPTTPYVRLDLRAKAAPSITPRTQEEN